MMRLQQSGRLFSTASAPPTYDRPRTTRPPPPPLTVCLPGRIATPVFKRLTVHKPSSSCMRCQSACTPVLALFAPAALPAVTAPLHLPLPPSAHPRAPTRTVFSCGCPLSYSFITLLSAHHRPPSLTDVIRPQTRQQQPAAARAAWGGTAADPAGLPARPGCPNNRSAQ